MIKLINSGRQLQDEHTITQSGIKAGDIMQWDFHLHETTDYWNGQTPYDIAMNELRHFQYASRFFSKGQVAPALVPNDDGELTDRLSLVAASGMK